jgi:hypothetical protein
MAAEPGTVQFSIGRVIGDSFGVLARNIVSFGLLALLIGVIQLLFVLFLFNPAEFEAAAGATPEQLEQMMAQFSWGLFFLYFVVLMVVTALTQAAIIYGTFQDLRGQKAGIGDCIARGLSSIVPVVVGSLLLSFGVMIGMILVIVPGIILLLMWWVYIPAIVVEGKGVIGGFGRSRELTRGRRWHILGLAVIVLVLTMVINFIVSFVTSAVASLTAQAIVEYAVFALITAFNSVLGAVGYYYLRAEKEGTDVNEIARIFD